MGNHYETESFSPRERKERSYYFGYLTVLGVPTVLAYIALAAILVHTWPENETPKPKRPDASDMRKTSRPQAAPSAPVCQPK